MKEFSANNDSNFDIKFHGGDISDTKSELFEIELDFFESSVILSKVISLENDSFLKNESILMRNYCKKYPKKMANVCA